MKTSNSGEYIIYVKYVYCVDIIILFLLLFNIAALQNSIYISYVEESCQLLVFMVVA